MNRSAGRKPGGLLRGRLRRAAAVAVILLLPALLAGGCGRKAKPEPLFGRAGSTYQYETR